MCIAMETDTPKWSVDAFLCLKISMSILIQVTVGSKQVEVVQNISPLPLSISKVVGLLNGIRINSNRERLSSATSKMHRIP